jgi:hypothetical protein
MAIENILHAAVATIPSITGHVDGIIRFSSRPRNVGWRRRIADYPGVRNKREINDLIPTDDANASRSLFSVVIVGLDPTIF